MKIAIVIPLDGLDKNKPNTTALLSYGFTLSSAFCDHIQYFCGWVPAPLDPRAHVLPQTTKHILEEECPLFAQRIRDFRPDIIEVIQNVEYAAYLARALPDMPVVFYHHNTGMAPHIHNALRESGHHLAHIISVSNCANQNLAAHLPKYKKKMSFIHNALVAEEWLAQDREKEKIILFCSRIHQAKGVEEFIKGVIEILPELEDWSVVVLAGSPAGKNHSQFDEFEDFVQQQKAIFTKEIGDKGLWIKDASRAQVQQWTKKAQIGVAASKYHDAFVLSLLEMHLANCAAISSGVSGMKEVSGPDGALYLKKVTSSAIAESLRFLMNNPQKRQALAQRGHQYVMRHHQIEDRAAQLDELRRQLVARFKQKGFFHTLFHHLRRPFKIKRDKISVRSVGSKK